MLTETNHNTARATATNLFYPVNDGQLKRQRKQNLRTYFAGVPLAFLLIFVAALVFKPEKLHVPYEKYWPPTPRSEF